MHSSDIIIGLTQALGGLDNIISWYYTPYGASFEVQELYLLECERFQQISSLQYIEHRINNNTVMIKTKDSEGLIKMMNEVVLVKSNDSTAHIRKTTYQDDLITLRSVRKHWWRDLEKTQYFMWWSEILKYTPSEQFEYWTYLMEYRVMKLKYEIKHRRFLLEAVMDLIRDFRMVDCLDYVGEYFDDPRTEAAHKAYCAIEKWFKRGMDKLEIY